MRYIYTHVIYSIHSYTWCIFYFVFLEKNVSLRSTIIYMYMFFKVMDICEPFVLLRVVPLGLIILIIDSYWATRFPSVGWAESLTRPWLCSPTMHQMSSFLARS